jgi:hypothetical protein
MAHVDVTRTGGSHDGLYAARVYWQDRRRLLRRLRQPSRCSRVRSCRISGSGGITSLCRRRWANGSWPGVGNFPETEQGPYTGLHTARVYWHDCRPLLRRLRQPSGCSPIRSRRISGFSGDTRSCGRAWRNSGPGADIRPGSCWRRNADPADPSGEDPVTAVIDTRDGRSRSCRPCSC